MSVEFPNNPTLNQVYQVGTRQWTWNGRAWQASSMTIGYTGSKGEMGSFGRAIVMAIVFGGG